MAIVLSISIANTKVDCVKPTDRIVFPDDAAVWNAYNAIQAQPMPDYRNTIVQPSPKEYEVITQFTLNLFKVCTIIRDFIDFFCCCYVSFFISLGIQAK